MRATMFHEAIAELRQALTLSGGQSLALAVLGYTLARVGDTTAAVDVLAQLHERAKQRDVPALHAAYVQIGLGSLEQAFQLMDKGYRQRAGLLVFLKVEPIFGLLRSDPRFTDLLRRLGFSRI